MKQEDIMQLSISEIKSKLKEGHDELMSFKLKTMTGEVQKTHLIKLNRKKIARLETALRSK